MLAEHTSLYVAKPEHFVAIDSALHTTGICLLHSEESGMGKSALLANYVQRVGGGELRMAGTASKRSDAVCGTLRSKWPRHIAVSASTNSADTSELGLNRLGNLPVLFA